MIDDEIPEPPTLPKPKLWVMWGTCLIGVSISAVLLNVAATKLLAFQAGIICTTSVNMLVLGYATRRRVAAMQTDMEQKHEALRVHMMVMPKLLERYGPEEAVAILNYAAILVSDGDFDDLTTAIHSIEHHHDNEPTPFDES